jgi:hypothetical protein
MPNRDAIRRQLAIIDDALGSLEFYCETEIVGDDCRHLLSDIKGAQRQHSRTDADKVEESWDVKPLYDRLKLVQGSLRVLRNNLDLSDAAVEKALDACREVSSSLEQDDEDDDL